MIERGYHPWGNALTQLRRRKAREDAARRAIHDGTAAWNWTHGERAAMARHAVTKLLSDKENET